MKELFDIIVADLGMVGCFLGLLGLTRAADILFGISLARKNSIDFDPKKFLWGLWHSFCMIAGLAALVTAMSIIVPLINLYGITLDEAVAQMLETISSLAIVAIIIYSTVVTYGKSAFDKFKEIISK